jgi:hypothetical protein
MKKNISIITVSFILLMSASTFAGNKDRAGQAGGSELLIMPYARSSGWANSNTSNIRGLEAMYLNVAGTAFTQKTEIVFAYTDWLKGSDVAINSFGFTQRVGETGVIGLGVMNMTFGEIDITTVNQPEGGIGKFRPSLLNIGLSYAKAFSNSIFGGIVLRVISESIADNSAQGIALDAGIQYVTGDNEQIKFGIALRNVGPSMRFDGDGLSFRGNVIGSDNQLTVQHRSAKFELPSLLNIGASYDFFLTDDKEHILTASGTFISNSFQKDNFCVGIQYDFKKILFLRAGFHYEDGIFSEMPERTTAYTGPTAGFSLQVPTSKESGSFISLDYSYRATNPYQGIHTIGARINL